MGMGYGMGNPRSQIERRNERMVERYGDKLKPATPEPAPEKRKPGRPKGRKNKPRGADR